MIFLIVGLVVFIILMCYFTWLMKDVSKYSRQTVEAFRQRDLIRLDIQLLKIQNAYFKHENSQRKHTQ